MIDAGGDPGPRHAHRDGGRRQVDRVGDERDARGAGAPAGRARSAVGRDACARLDAGRREHVRCRQLRRFVRRLVDRREHRLHQRPERHRLLQPRRLLHGAVLVLQGIPGQDRRLLGGVRPHDRRRDQRGDPLGHERVRLRHRGRVGAELAAVLQDRPVQPRRHAAHHRQPRRVRPDQRHGVRVRPDHQGPAVLLRAVRSARLQQAQHRTTRRRFFDDGVRTMLLGREDRLADHRRHLLELLAFSDENERVTDTFAYRRSRTPRRAHTRTRSFNESAAA